MTVCEEKKRCEKANNEQLKYKFNYKGNEQERANAPTKQAKNNSVLSK